MLSSANVGAIVPRSVQAGCDVLAESCHRDKPSRAPQVDTLQSQPRLPHAFESLNQFQNPRLGTRIVFVTDDFFGKASRLLKMKPAVFEPNRYDRRGKYMDGLESRRKREPGHDYCVIQLGVPCVLKGVDVDTSHFIQNNAEWASIEACYSENRLPNQSAQWQEVLPKVPLQGNSHHLHPVAHEHRVTHIKFHFYPDGGVARLRLYGEVKPDLRQFKANKTIDLLALQNGGRALSCSNQHFGSMHHLNFPAQSIGMMDGWETGRRRHGGNDWVLLALGVPGEISKLIVGTKFFKGNYPDRVSVEAAFSEADTVDEPEKLQWKTLLPEHKLKANSTHQFRQLNAVGVVSHLRMQIYPDGGISRLRVLGQPRPN